MLEKLEAIYPDLTFLPGKSYCWSPENRHIYYPHRDKSALDSNSLLHEVAHAVLNHSHYVSDFELLSKEVDAWEEAKNIASSFDVVIEENNIQDCLDTYRDWLHVRSTCPTCGNKSLQDAAGLYDCFNCHTTWKVSAERFCRPYRALKKPNTHKRSPASKTLAIFA